jgi:hypothetical protein
MSTMVSMAPSLAALQQRMQAHVLSGDAAAMADVQAGGGLDAERRLGIYHHAYRARLLETLRDTYGHTLRYLGDEWFDHLALAFIACTPSAHSNLRWYGGSWPAWLADALGAASAMGHHPEVAELAGIDWALRRAFDAADAPVLTMHGLAALPAEAWATAVLHAQPSVQVLTLRHNTIGLWHALDQEGEVPAAEPLGAPLPVLVWRRDERPHFRSMAAAEASAVQALLHGRSFAEICADLAEAYPDLDAALAAGGMLRQWVADGVLARVS